MGEYYDIELDNDDTIFKVEEFYWYINQTDDTYWVETYFPRLKLSATYNDFFRSFEDAFYYANSTWGSFLYKEDYNEIE